MPVSVAGISTAMAITAGDFMPAPYCTVAPLNAGAIMSTVELGNGTTTESNIPVRVHAIYAATSLAAGVEHTCALFSGGMMRCWGCKRQWSAGQSADEPAPNPLPVTVVGTPGVVWTKQ